MALGPKSEKSGPKTVKNRKNDPQFPVFFPDFGAWPILSHFRLSDRFQFYGRQTDSQGYVYFAKLFVLQEHWGSLKSAKVLHKKMFALLRGDKPQLEMAKVL